RMAVSAACHTPDAGPSLYVGIRTPRARRPADHPPPRRGSCPPPSWRLVRLCPGAAAAPANGAGGAATDCYRKGRLGRRDVTGGYLGAWGAGSVSPLSMIFSVSPVSRAAG